MKKLHLLLFVVAMISLSSCGKKVFMITSGSENLTSLTKITDGKSICRNPGGSTEGDALFYAQTQANERTGSFLAQGLISYASAKIFESNIYKKDVPTAPAQVQITSGSPCLYPTYCKANDRIALSRLVNGYFDIYMMPATKGNALIPVTETSNINELAPSISPDGNFLVYQKGNMNSVESEIWLKNLQTGENMLLGMGATPSISPDGKKIAYAKIESNKSCNIWVMEIDGSNARQLTVSKDEFAEFPKWSPSGEKIIFQANKKKGNFDIFIMNADGSGLMQLTTNESEDLTPFWSGDGYIYFASDRGAAHGSYNIWRFRYND